MNKINLAACRAVSCKIFFSILKNMLEGISSNSFSFRKDLLQFGQRVGEGVDLIGKSTRTSLLGK